MSGIYCPQCGKLHESEGKFCEYCGYDLEDVILQYKDKRLPVRFQYEPPPTQPLPPGQTIDTKPRKEFGKTRWFISIIVLLIFIGLITFASLSGVPIFISIILGILIYAGFLIGMITGPRRSVGAGCYALIVAVVVIVVIVVKVVVAVTVEIAVVVIVEIALEPKL